MEENRSAFYFLTGTPTANIILLRPWRRWEDNFRMDLKEVDIITSNWIKSAQDRDYWRALVNTALSLQAS